IDVRNVTVTMPIKCSNGTTPAGGPLVIPFPDQHFSIPLNSNAWYPASNAALAIGYQDVVPAPAVCAGIGTGQLRNAGGDVLTATVDATDTPVFIKWHFAIPASKGYPNIDCSDPAANPGTGVAACSAGWSGKVDP